MSRNRWLFKWQHRRLDRELMALWLHAAEHGQDGLLEAEVATFRRYGQHWSADQWERYVAALEIDPAARMER